MCGNACKSTSAMIESSCNNWHRARRKKKTGDYNSGD